MARGGGGAAAAATDELRAALHYFAAALAAGRAFELLEAALKVFVQVHRDELLAAPALRGALLRLVRVQDASWGRMREAMHTNLCLLSHLTRVKM